MKGLLAAFAGFALMALYLIVRTSSGEGEIYYYAPDNYVERANGLIRKGVLTAECLGNATRIATDWQMGSEFDRDWYADSYLRSDVELFNQDPDRYGWYFIIDNDCRLLGVNEIVHTIALPFATPHRWRGAIYYSGEGSDAALRSAGRRINLRHPERPIRAAEEALTHVGSLDPITAESVLLVFGNRARPAVRLHHVGDEVVLNNRIRDIGEIRLLGRLVPPGRIGRLETGDWLHLERHRSETFVYADGEARPAASTVRRRNDTYHRETVDDALGWVEDPIRDEWQTLIDVLAAGVGRALGKLPQERAKRLRSGFDLQLTLQQDLQRRLNQVMHEHFHSLARSPAIRDDFEAGVTVMDGRTGDVLALMTYPWPQDISVSTGDSERVRRRRLLNQNFVRHPIGSAVKPFFFAAIANAHPSLLGLVIDEHQPEARHQELLHCWLPLGYQLLSDHFGRIDFRKALEISCNKYAVELATLALAAEGRRRTPDAFMLAGSSAQLPRDDSTAWPTPGQRSGIYVQGRELTYAPDLGEFLTSSPLPPRVESHAARLCGPLDRLELASFRQDLEVLTGVSTYRGKAPRLLPEKGPDYFYSSYITGNYDLRPWRQMLSFLIEDPDQDHAWPVRAAFQELSPERVNLAFNNATDLRLDYVSMALGGASSTWTNVQVAEALARLVTGRRIEARLIRAILPTRTAVEAPTDGVPEVVSKIESSSSDSTIRSESEPGVPPARADQKETAAAGPSKDPTIDGQRLDLLPIEPRVRLAVLEGMKRVVEGDSGTAKSLRPRLASLRAKYPGHTVMLLSKTGSPVLLRPASRATGQALDQLVPGYLMLESGQLILRLGDRTALYRSVEQPGRDAFLNLLDGALRAAGFRFGRGRQFRRIARLVDRYYRDRADLSFNSSSQVPSGLDSPLYDVAGRLLVNRDDALFTQRLLRDKGAVYTFAVVRVPSRLGPMPEGIPTPEQLSDPDSQVVAVAIHLTLGPDSSLAVAATNRLLSEIDLLEF